ncbi:MAG: hypothetical protein ABI251_07715 [Mycobacteriaceae bacterium]
MGIESPAPVDLEKGASAPATPPVGPSLPGAPKRGRVFAWVIGAAAALLVAALVAVAIAIALVPAAGVDAQREQFIQTARQGVLNLTTIHYATAPADVQHLLDGASGDFAKDFGGRKDSYIQVVQKAQVNSDGKIETAGVEKIEGNTGVVLVASTAKVSNSSAPGAEDRSYRLRVTVTDADGRMTVSNVQFVP